jgi:catecholate siderophore receptor
MKHRTRLPRAKAGRRRGRTRLFVLGAACLTPLAAATPALAAPEQQGPVVAGTAARAGVQRFDIAPGSLDTVLAAFERATKIRPVLNDPGLRSLQSPGVSGNFTAEQAMGQLLTGLAVRATFDGSAVTLAVRGVNEFVEVAGSVPRNAQSPKYRDEIRDTPQEIVVIPQKVFEEQSATTLVDVLRNTPGITMSIGEGASGTVSFGDNIFIRGFNVRNDIYIDGARDPGEVTRDTFNVESVEVAKGPTSVTGGRGSTGGSINMVTKAATLADSASGRLTFGNADHKRGTFDVNHRLTDSVAFRVNAMWQDAGYPGRDIQKNKAWGFAPTIGLGIGKPTTVTVSYSRLQQNNVPDLGIPTLFPDNAIAAGLTVNDLDFHNYYSIASRDYEDTTSDVVTGIVSHRFNSTFTLRNLTRYGKNYRDAVSTPPRPVTTAANQGSTDPGYNPSAFQLRRTDTKYQHRTDKVTTNQTDLASEFKTGRVSHSADIGIEFAADRQPTYAFTDTFANGRPPVIDLLHPDPLVSYTPTYAKTGATSNADANSTALYVFDTVHFNDQFQADLGIRYDRVKIDYETLSATGVVANFGRDDNATTGRAGLVYKPVEKGSIYTAFSTSFAPVYDATHGLTLAATGATGQALGPEKSRNFEIGTKWDLGEAVYFTAAFFNLRKTDAKTTDLAGAVTLLGDQRVNGVEFTVAGTILPRWNVYGGVSFMDGEVLKSAQPSEEGVILPYVPKAMLNLWSTYQLPMRLTVGGGVNYSDGNFFNQTGTFNFVAGGTVSQPKYATNAAAIQALTKYWVFNAMASYPVNRHLTLQVNLNNIGNEQYADRGYDRHFMPGPARQVLFSPVFSF